MKYKQKRWVWNMWRQEKKVYLIRRVTSIAKLRSYYKGVYLKKKHENNL